MVALDTGCVPNIFSIEIAELLEKTEKIIAVNMQKEMLEIIRKKIDKTPFVNNIVLHKYCQKK